MRQQPENLPAGGVSLVGAALVVIIALLSWFAWWLVKPTPMYLTLPPTTLEHQVFTGEGPNVGEPQLDRNAEIDKAINEVVNDPSLIGGRK
jgi:hypothetical protein